MSDIQWYRTVTALAGHLAWPLVVLLVAIIYRGSLRRFIAMLPARLSRLAFPGFVSVDLVPSAAPVTQQPQILNYGGSYVAPMPPSLPHDLEGLISKLTPGGYILIQLGEGTSWLSSRLYLFAAMLRTRAKLKYFVFVEKSASSRKAFVGAASTLHVEQALAEFFPWLAYTYTTAPETDVPPSGAGSARSTINSFLRCIQIKLVIDDEDIVCPSLIPHLLRKEDDEALRAVFGQLDKDDKERILKRDTPDGYVINLLNAMINKRLFDEDAILDKTNLHGLTEIVKSTTANEVHRYLNRIIIQRLFFQNIRTGRTIPDDINVKEDKVISISRDWNRLENRDNSGTVEVVWEHGSWLTAGSIDQILGETLNRGVIRQSELIERSQVSQRDLVLASSGDLIGLVDDSGRFEDLIDRAEITDRFAKEAAHSA